MSYLLLKLAHCCRGLWPRFLDFKPDRALSRTTGSYGERCRRVVGAFHRHVVSDGVGSSAAHVVDDDVRNRCPAALFLLFVSATQDVRISSVGSVGE